MPNIATDFAAFINTAYPYRNLMEAAEKKPFWIRNMAAGGLTEFNRSKASWQMWAHDDTIGENLMYAQGVQDVEQYRRFTGKGEGLSADSIEVTNRDNGTRGGSGGSADPLGLDSIIKAPPLPILPVKLRGLKATIMQSGYEATITALGKKAEQEAREHEAEVRLWMDFGKDYQQQGMTPPPGLPDPMPATEPELQTYLDDWQVGAAAALERKVQICAIESGQEQIMSEIADDLLNHGYGAEVDFQLDGKRPVSKRILPSRGLFLPSAFPDYRDQDQFGYLETLNLDDLLAEAADNKLTCNGDGKEWTKDDRDRLRQLGAKSLPDNVTIDERVGLREGTGAITVVRWYFRTNDLRRWKEYTDDQGNVRRREIKKANYELKGRGKLIDMPMNCLYECTMIAGTNMAYNCQRVGRQGRDLHDPQKARLPCSVYMVAVNGRPVSVVRNAKGIVDEIERSWRGYMAVKRTYTPAGSNIPPSQLTKMAEDMKIPGGADGAYKFIKQFGDSFFEDYDAEQPNRPQGPRIYNNPFGIPEAAAQHLADMFQQLQLLEMVTGANAVVSAQSPGGEAGKGVNQIALQGAANVMEYLRTALLRINENNARNIAGRIWLTEKNVPIVGAVPGRGGKMQQVGPRHDLHEYEFFMRVNLGPNPEDLKELKDKAFAATQGGPQAQLTFDHYLKIEELLEVPDLKTARRYMAMAIAKKMRDDQSNAQQLQAQNGDVQTQTAQAAAQAQDQADEKAHARRMNELEYVRTTSWGGIDRQTAAQRDIAGLNSQTKRETAIIAEEGQTHRELAGQAAQHQHEHESTILDAALQPEPTMAE